MNELVPETETPEAEKKESRGIKWYTQERIDVLMDIARSKTRDMNTRLKALALIEDIRNDGRRPKAKVVQLPAEEPAPQQPRFSIEDLKALGE